MGFVYEKRSSASPFVETVWRTEDTADGFYLAAADGVWDLLFTTDTNNRTSVTVSGPSSRATAVPYKKGNRKLGIRFKPGSFLPQLPAMLDVVQMLPERTKRSFWFLGENWELPTFANADDYLAKLAQRKLLFSDTIVTAALDGHQPGISDRSMQRHFLQAVGLSPRYMRNIQRANQAVAFLQNGRNISEIVVQLSYADQAHMTRWVKRISGCTPGDIVKRVESCRLRSIQGYGACAEMRVQNFKGASYDDKTV